MGLHTNKLLFWSVIIGASVQDPHMVRLKFLGEDEDVKWGDVRMVSGGVHTVHKPINPNVAPKTEELIPQSRF